ncbi:dephospho-CoA kinase [Coprobacter tertius]|uniref:Dephospho-CoA kinase n=1 Tax=Coprobacter tertius TaxID=2944915 RepID=A0ABT1MGT5_9BACT|nr:dephospho-CoA kinase [Coprobacter tertius]MCP9611842.1 dephospho-CoA kinase [Coprobacter tertius]
MVTIGITGGIGSGKSLVSRFIRLCGYPVYDTDIKARKLMEESVTIRSGLTGLLGDVYTGNTLDRAQVASAIFGNDDLRKQVNSIVHPVVRQDFEEWTLTRNKEFVFLESAILFESGLEQLLDKVWTVTAPVELRITRVMNRNRCTREDVLARIEAQMDEEEKCRRADVIIYNDDCSAVIPQILAQLSSM